MIKKYENELISIKASLALTIDDLRQFSINLALEGKWKDMVDDQNTGVVFSFTDKMLHNTGDNNINLLLAMKDNLISALRKMGGYYRRDNFTETESLYEIIKEKQTGFRWNIVFRFVDKGVSTGHGVCLIHIDLELIHREVGFIEGFSWKNNPGKRLVSVRLLSFAGVGIEDKSEYNRITEDIRDSVRHFFTDKELRRFGTGKITEKIGVHYNA